MTKNPLDPPPLLRVDEAELAAEDGIRRWLFDDHGRLTELIDEILLRRWAAAHGIKNDDAELQLAADEMRYQRRLESVERLNSWLAEHRQTLLSLQEGLDYRLLRNKIRAAISDDEIADYFAEHRLEFERLELWSLRVKEADTARELRSQIVDDGEDFHRLARELSEDADTRPAGGWIGRVARHDLDADIEAAVFAAGENSVVGPIATAGGFNLLKVGRRLPAELAREREEIRLRIFRELVERLRREANVETPLLEP